MSLFCPSPRVFPSFRIAIKGMLGRAFCSPEVSANCLEIKSHNGTCLLEGHFLPVANYQNRIPRNAFRSWLSSPRFISIKSFLKGNARTLFPTQDGTVNIAHFLACQHERDEISVMHHHQGPSLVQGLGASQCPPYIPRRIVSIIINSIQRMLGRWSAANMCNKGLKGFLPFWSNRNAPATIVVVSLAFWVGATLPDAVPNFIFRGFISPPRIAVAQLRSANKVSPLAATGLGGSSSNPGYGPRSFGSAGALAKNKCLAMATSVGDAKDGEVIELLANRNYLFHRGDFSKSPSVTLSKK